MWCDQFNSSENCMFCSTQEEAEYFLQVIKEIKNVTSLTANKRKRTKEKTKLQLIRFTPFNGSNCKLQLHDFRHISSIWLKAVIEMRPLKPRGRRAHKKKIRTYSSHVNSRLALPQRWSWSKCVTSAPSGLLVIYQRRSAIKIRCRFWWNQFSRLFLGSQTVPQAVGWEIRSSKNKVLFISSHTMCSCSLGRTGAIMRLSLELHWNFLKNRLRILVGFCIFSF